MTKLISVSNESEIKREELFDLNTRAWNGEEKKLKNACNFIYDGISSLYYRTTEATAHDIAVQVERLTIKQRSHFDAIVDCISTGNRNQSNLFFIDAPTGRGKTFLIDFIIKSLRRNNNKMLISSYGIK
ncbi:hypothetical protein DAPK24_022610 [Pichia kluyveri]|uniref:ATP-dependent DNA helicase n=1 Tax=Pichia kluyveri TaxID=36015 RepID=A0AAV5R517_PICKL|nr:hypothetical protein DAPK24_022610 [Pichia kluyveri]